MEYLTHEQRKAKYEFQGDYFKFNSVRDLSEQVIITPLPITTDTIKYATGSAKGLLTKDVALFIGMWMIETYPLLNGFSGLDTISFDTTNL
jgi:hypothetical protein